MAAIPNFQLYGERDSSPEPGFVHLETIASRGRLNDWDIRPHSHATLDQLLVIRAGRVEVRIDGQEVRLRGPAVIHVPASAVHGFRFDDDVVGDVLSFSAELRGILATSRAGPVALPDRPLARAVDAATLGRLASLCDQLYLECAGHHEGGAAASAWLVGLLLLHVRRVAGGQAGALGIDARATRFRQLVDRHFREQRPVAFYADRLGMTERTLARLARAWLGCAPAAHLRGRLLLEARRQLLYGTSPIARIAEDLGFADASYFTRFYRRMTGETPSTARRQGPARPRRVRAGG